MTTSITFRPEMDKSGDPSDPDAQPVFGEPWQAQAFAIVLRLQEAGHVGRQEWTQRLAAEIAAAQNRGDPDLGDTYYHHWLAALEKLVLDKHLALADELRGRQNQLAASAAVGHAHPARRTPIAVAGSRQ